MQLPASADDLVLDFRVEPARPGRNFITVGVYQTRRPAPAPVRGVTLRITEAGAAPRTVPLVRAGDDQWQTTETLTDGRLRLEAAVERPGLRTSSAATPLTVTRHVQAIAVPATSHAVMDRPLEPILRPLAIAAAAMLAVVLLLRRLRRWRLYLHRRAVEPEGRWRHSALLAAAVLLLAALGGSSASRAAAGPPMHAVIVRFDAQANLTGLPKQRRQRLHDLVTRLQHTSDTTQPPVLRLLQTRRKQGLVSHMQSLWVFNGLAVTATDSVIDELAAMPQVASVTPDPTGIVPTATPQWNVSGRQRAGRAGPGRHRPRNRRGEHRHRGRRQSSRPGR